MGEEAGWERKQDGRGRRMGEEGGWEWEEDGRRRRRIETLNDKVKSGGRGRVRGREMLAGERKSDSRDGHKRGHGDRAVVTGLHLEHVLLACLKVKCLQESDDTTELVHRER